MTLTHIEERLRADLPRLADVLTGEPAPLVATVLVPQCPRRRRLVAAVAAVVAVALVAGIAIAATRRSDDSGSSGVVGGVTTGSP